jgi:phytoene synthase
MNWTSLRIFQQGSKTYFYSSLFFPLRVRRDVFTLYAFVRRADDYVDAIPQQIQNFYKFKERYLLLRRDPGSGYDPVISPFVELCQRKNFAPDWIDSFLYSMELDTHKREYNTLAETLEYIYGSAEVIGLMMSSILDLPQESFPFARAQGRAMQYINFIRDIQEDLELGRRYLPLPRELASLDTLSVGNHIESFDSWLRTEIERYRQWQTEAEKGYPFIPPRYRIPIKTASDMYNWTARQIEAKPSIVYSKKVKPSSSRILSRISKNALAELFTSH